MKRLTAVFAGMRKTFSSEDGAHYRGYEQPVEPIKEHIKQLDDSVNSAPASGNPNGWRYAGSIPMVLLMDWLKVSGTPIDVWARNEGGAKDSFLAWLRSAHPQVFVSTARPLITVPSNYSAQKNAHVEGS